MNRKFLYATSLVAAATMVLTAVSPSAAAPMKQDDKVLRINLGTYPDIIDPQKSSFVNEIAHLKLIYEGLTKLNDKLETVPGAAEKWKYSKDGLTLTFNLRKDLKYSDGTPLNAKRFEYSIIRNINPATAGEYGTITDEILGAPEWQDAAANNADADTLAKAEEVVRSSVQALDATGQPCTDYDQADCQTLQVKLSKPAPYFHTVLGLWVTYPAKEENITDGGENWWNSSKYQVGNGPFVLTNFEPSVRALFVPNPNYWGGKRRRRTSSIRTSPTALWPSKPTRTTSSTSSPCRRKTWRLCRPIRPQQAGHDLPWLLHDCIAVPQLQEALQRSEGARGICLCPRPRALGEGRAARPRRADPDLDPARIPWLQAG